MEKLCNYSKISWNVYIIIPNILEVKHFPKNFGKISKKKGKKLK